MGLSPLVSIIIPVFNGSNYLREAIDSALSQSYGHIEVIVINDGSTDGGATEQIALSYGARIRYYSKPNGGVSTALNIGLREMRGEYFSWLSHDDRYKPDKIRKQMEFLSQLDDKKTILYGSYEIINHKSKKIDIVQFDKLYPITQLNKSLFPIFRGLANGCSMLIHRSHYERVGLFDEDLRTTQDYDMWFRMFREAEVRYCPGVYLQMRFHSEQTGRKVAEHNEECDRLWIWMINCLDEQEMCYLEGTSYQFYKLTLRYLKTRTEYVKAIAHTSYLLEKAVPPQGVNLSEGFGRIKLSEGDRLLLIKRIYYCIRYEGTMATINKIIRKIR
ncbi:putative glycosyl transferase family protein [Paenibacillus agaridevorans]|uniref:Putative glycosyl transferase family protein n=1 Tax=Paenibacillus agaridevorans TaxID=171404 RepID=A0A2R5EQS8_9BACL|nr:glycosyltransferase [Paenibacillus agaridevorans]GBG08019.1 putative glycosyl transferase family protein [Paenibacillus agaridevorans]